MRKMKKAKLAITPAKLIQCHKAEDKQKRAFVVRANADPYFWRGEDGKIADIRGVKSNFVEGCRMGPS